MKKKSSQNLDKINEFNKFLKKILKLKRVKNTSVNNCSEWDSINHLTIIFKLESLFKLKIKNNTVPKLTSYKKIIKYLNR
jgi:acyl carrier protein